MTINPQRAQTLFLAALEVSDSADRRNLLDRECADDTTLRQRVEALLGAHDATGGFGVEPSGPALAATKEMSTAVRPGTIVAGRYKLLQQIGEGGMGTVWMADQTEPVKRRVAIKLIRIDRGNSAMILSRFEAERQAIAMMDHSNIAKLLDAGKTEAGEPFFVMELVKGVPLTDFCDAHKLSIPERLSLFMQICSAVQHAHQKGIIHRDLKPGNILVESHDGKPVPKIIDFGLAKAASGMQLSEHTLFTGFGNVMGTPLYMAPEQANFNAIDVDTRADIYALGVILYELLTGTTPITRDTVKKAAIDEMMRLIREQEAPTPSSRLSSSDSKPTVAANRQTEPQKLGRFVKGELDWIVLKALSKDRDRRYETANGFAKDIERFLNNEPVQAGPPSVGYKLRKFVQRNRPQVLAGCLLLATLLIGICGTTIGFYRAEIAQGKTIKALNVVTEEQKKTETALKKATESEAQARKADSHNRRIITRQYIERGSQLAKDGRLTGALSWFVAAFQKEEGILTPDEEWGHRMRIGNTLRQIPTPVASFEIGGKPQHALFSDDAKQMLSVTRLADQRLEMQVWDVATKQSLTGPISIGTSTIKWIEFHDDCVIIGSPDGNIPRAGRKESSWPSERVEIWSIASRRIEQSFQVIGSVYYQPNSLGVQGAARSSSMSLFYPNHLTRVAVEFKSSGDLTSPIIRTSLVDLKTLERTEIPVEWFERMVYWSPDGSRVVVLRGEMYELYAVKPNVEKLCEFPFIPWKRVNYINPVRGSLFSEDGRRAISVTNSQSDDSSPARVQIWDASRGVALYPPIEVDTRSGFALSPNGSHFLVDGLSDIQVYDAATGKQISSILCVKTAQIYNATFSPDGKSVITASTKRLTAQPVGDARPISEATPVGEAGTLVQLFDTATGRALTDPMRSSSSSQFGEFSLLSDKILGSSTAFREWFDPHSTANSTNRLQTELLHLPDTMGRSNPDLAKSVSSSQDKKRLLINQQQGTRLWDVTTSQPLSPEISVHGMATFATFLGKTRQFCTGGEDGRICLWDPDRQGDEVNAYLPDLILGREQVPGTDRFLLYRWQGGGLYYNGQESPGYACTVIGATGDTRFPDLPCRLRLPKLVLNGTRLVHEHLGELSIWDTASARPILSIKSGPDDDRFLFAVSDDGEKMVGVEQQADVRWWDVRSGKLIAGPIPYGGIGRAGRTAVKFRNQLVTTETRTGDAGQIESRFSVWKPDSFSPLQTPWLPVEWDDTHIMLSPDASLFSVKPPGKTGVSIWDRETGIELVSFPNGTLQFVPQGAIVLLSNTEEILWDRKSGQSTTRNRGLDADQILARAQKMPRQLRGKSGRSKYFGFVDYAYVWDATTQTSITSPLSIPDPILGATISEDGQTVLTWTGSDVRLWDANSGAPIGAPLVQDATILSAGILSDSRIVWVTMQDSSPKSDTRLVSFPGISGGTGKVSVFVNSLRWIVPSRVYFFDCLTGHSLGPPLTYELPTISESEFGTRQPILDASSTSVYTHPTIDTLRKTPFVRDTRSLHELITLAEAIGANRFQEPGLLLPIPSEELAVIRRRMAKHLDGVVRPKEEEWHRREAIALVRGEKWEAAELHLRWLLEQKHQDWQILNKLAACRSHIGDHTQAIELYERCRKMEGIQNRPGTADAILISLNLANEYNTTGKKELAMQLWEPAIPLAENQLGIGDPKTTAAKLGLVNALEASRRWDEALPLRKEQFQNARDRRNPEHNDYQQAAGFYGMALLKTGGFVEAESILRELKAIRQANAPDAWTTFNSMSLLGTALLGQKKYAEAEPLLLKGFEGLKQRAKTIPPQGSMRILEALERLIELYTVWHAAEPDKGHDVKAAECQKKLDDYKAATTTPSATAKPEPEK